MSGNSTTAYLITTCDKGTTKPEGVLGFAYLNLQRAQIECSQRDISCEYRDHFVYEIPLDKPVDIFFIIRQYVRSSHKYMGVVGPGYSDLNEAKSMASERYKEDYPDCLHYVSQIVVHD